MNKIMRAGATSAETASSGRLEELFVAHGAVVLRFAYYLSGDRAEALEV
jgi:DNA-directed RNA polymerase specialized sigma24 family protein